MRILILTGLQEELLPFLERRAFQFDRARGAYRSLQHPDLLAATTGPGVKKARELRKLLRSFVPHVIVNAGLVGLLRETDERQAGDRVRLGGVTDARTGVVYPGGPGRGQLVSVPAPVFEPSDKLDLATKYRASVCDMEAAVLLGMIGQVEEVATGSFVVFCKVVGDRPDSYNLYRYEHLVRGWQRRGRWQKLWNGLRFPGGPGRLRELLAMKEQGLQGLAHSLDGLVASLLQLPEYPGIDPDGDDSGGPISELRGLDSVFIPH